MTRAVIALVDGANFYVSVERAFNVTLVCRPVVVLSNGDSTIVAASAEAKRLGLRRGMAVFACRDLLRQHRVAIFSSNFSLYQDVSDRVMQLLSGYAEERDGVRHQEIESIDECFLSLAHVPGEQLVAYAQAMRAHVWRATGIPVRVGIGRTKVEAKLAAQIARRAPADEEVVNLATCEEAERTSLLETIKVEDVWGIGKQSCATLARLSITTARELRDADPTQIRALLSVVGQRLVYELRGIVCMPLSTKRKPKQGIMASRSFGRPLTSMAEVAEALACYAAIAAEKLRRQASVAGAISMFVSTSRFASTPQYAGGASRRFPFPTNATPDLIVATRDLLAEVFRAGYE